MSAAFGERLREHRSAAGLTQAELAQRAGLSEQAIGLLERGIRTRPRQSTVEALTAALDLSPEAARELAQAAGDRPQRTRADSADAAAATVSLVPRQLPPAIADFTARKPELDQVVAALRGEGKASAVVTVTGMGGVGKTALAVYAGHLTAEQFPDGQLYVKLRGYVPGGALGPAAALGQLLRSLGVPPDAIPSDTDELAAMYRSAVAGRRMLVLLDDASSIGQVMPLIPGDPNCAAIITSRRFLATLPGNRIIRLSAMAEDDALSLLSVMVGNRRLAAEQRAARDISRLTGGLPLALRLVGARLAARPTWRLQDIVDQLNDEHRRLDELGVEQSGVRASFAGSINELLAGQSRLDQEAVRAFDLLSLTESSEISVPLVARLLDRTMTDTAALLERLVDLHLLDSVGPRSYRLHDLLRTYAGERLAAPHRQAERDAAIERGLKLYVAAAWRAHRITHPWSTRHPTEQLDETDVPSFDDLAAALGWIDSEFDSMLGLYRRAEAIPGGQQRFGPSLALGLFGYLEARAYWGKMRLVYDLGITAADPDQDPSTAGWLLHDRAIPDVEEGDATTGRTRVLRSFELFERAGDVVGMARCCSTLSHIHERLDRLDESVSWGERGLALSRQVGDSGGIGANCLALGVLYQRAGRGVDARRAFQESFELAEADGNVRSLARRRRVAGVTCLEQGQFGEAVAHLSVASQVFRRLDDPSGLAESLGHLSTVELAQGRPAAAEVHAQEALALAEKYHDAFRQGTVLGTLASIKDAIGAPEVALTLRRRALDVFEAHRITRAANALRELLDPTD
jgi:transcriptional regulator with XRE-family HTH domain